MYQHSQQIIGNYWKFGKSFIFQIKQIGTQETTKQDFESRNEVQLIL
jgi:hypothetical protein